MKKFNKYQAQITLPNFGIDAQKRLQKSHVVVIGIGGLGCPAVQCLAGAGVGKITIIDGDEVKESNLHRQFLFSHGDVGKQKVPVALNELNRKFNKTSFIGFDAMIDSENVTELIGTCEVILDCTDNPATRYVLDDYCRHSGTPLVYAGVHQYEGQLSVFHYEAGYTYRGLFPESEILTSPSCSETGVMNTLTQMFGSLQANEAIKILTGYGKVTSGDVFVFDVRKNKSEVFKLEKPTLSDHNKKNQKESPDSVNTLNTIELNNNRELYFLIDLSDESDGFLPDGLVPDARLYLNELKENLDKMNLKKSVVFTCERGLKSRIAAISMKKQMKGSEVFVLTKQGETTKEKIEI